MFRNGFVVIVVALLLFSAGSMGCASAKGRSSSGRSHASSSRGSVHARAVTRMFQITADVRWVMLARNFRPLAPK
jgi:hypothetical protein